MWDTELWLWTQKECSSYSTEVQYLNHYFIIIQYYNIIQYVNITMGTMNVISGLKLLRICYVDRDWETSSSLSEWVSEWILFNANSVIFQLYHVENKLIFNKVCFVLDQHTELDFYNVCSLKQQSTDRHVGPFGHIILIPRQPVFDLSP